MRSNSAGTYSFLAISLFSYLLFGVLGAGCARQETGRVIVQRTIRALQATAESLGYPGPNFRHAIEVLESDGFAAPPTMLGAVVGDATSEGYGWIYDFMWVDIRNEVRGFYFRVEGEQDIEVFPTILNEPQVEGTAWMVQAGPIVTSAREIAKLRGEAKARAILVDPRILEVVNLHAGLVLADGRKSEPIEVLMRRKGPQGWFDLSRRSETEETPRSAQTMPKGASHSQGK